MRSRVLWFLMWAVFAVPLGAQATPRVAVLGMVLAGGLDAMTVSWITDIIIEELSRSEKYQVIERSAVDLMLDKKEMRLPSGEVESKGVRQVGKYLDADFVVVTRAYQFGHPLVLEAEMIDVATGEIVHLAQASYSYEQLGDLNVLLDAANLVGRRLAGLEESEPLIAGPITQPAFDKVSPTDCESAFELGHDSGNRHARRGWVWFGWGFTTLCGLVGFFSALDSVEAPLHYSLAGSGIGLGISILAPLVFTQRPDYLPDTVYQECYLHGYMRAARMNNMGYALLGSLLGVGTAAIASEAIYSAVAVGMLGLMFMFLGELGCL